jgi:hypoxanthine phosphoribosyltransferase
MNFKPVRFKNDKVAYLAPSWQEMGELTFLLAKKILASKKKFDRLITMAKGGWTWSRTMVDYLGIEEVASIQVKFYSGIFETKPSPVIAQSLPIPVLKEKLLVFDDVADSGETLIAVKKYLHLCGAKSITSAALFYKSWARFVPDYYGSVTESWIIFPHEIRESIKFVGTNWEKQGLKPREIKQRLIQIGLDKKQVEYFLKKDEIKVNSMD